MRKSSPDKIEAQRQRLKDFQDAKLSIEEGRKFLDSIRRQSKETEDKLSIEANEEEIERLKRKQAAIQKTLDLTPDWYIEQLEGIAPLETTQRLEKTTVDELEKIEPPTSQTPLRPRSKSEVIQQKITDEQLEKTEQMIQSITKTDREQLKNVAMAFVYYNTLRDPEESGTFLIPGVSMQVIKPSSSKFKIKDILNIIILDETIPITPTFEKILKQYKPDFTPSPERQIINKTNDYRPTLGSRLDSNIRGNLNNQEDKINSNEDLQGVKVQRLIGSYNPEKRKFETEPEEIKKAVEKSKQKVTKIVDPVGDIKKEFRSKIDDLIEDTLDPNFKETLAAMRSQWLDEINKVGGDFLKAKELKDTYSGALDKIIEIRNANLPAAEEENKIMQAIQESIQLAVQVTTPPSREVPLAGIVEEEEKVPEILQEEEKVPEVVNPETITSGDRPIAVDTSNVETTSQPIAGLEPETIHQGTQREFEQPPVMVQRLFDESSILTQLQRVEENIQAIKNYKFNLERLNRGESVRPEELKLELKPTPEFAQVEHQMGSDAQLRSQIAMQNILRVRLQYATEYRQRLDAGEESTQIEEDLESKIKAVLATPSAPGSPVGSIPTASSFESEEESQVDPTSMQQQLPSSPDLGAAGLPPIGSSVASDFEQSEQEEITTIDEETGTIQRVPPQPITQGTPPIEEVKISVDFHKLQVALFFGSITDPDFDDELTRSYRGFLEQTGIPPKQRNQMMKLIIAANGNKLMITEPETEDDENELLILLQLHFNIERNLHRGTRQKTGSVNLGQLMGLRRSIQPTTTQPEVEDPLGDATQLRMSQTQAAVQAQDQAQVGQLGDLESPIEPTLPDGENKITDEQIGEAWDNRIHHQEVGAYLAGEDFNMVSKMIHRPRPQNTVGSSNFSFRDNYFPTEVKIKVRKVKPRSQRVRC
jgi:hypothetical protein